ncbi:MAG: ROK family protein [Candidatus Woesearchaeota archaeon]|nr:ROK family protein [Candidatus Woesearchaeota archaeon]
MIAIDLGGTKIAAAVVNRGKITKRVTVPTGARKGKRHVLNQLRKILKELGPGRVGIGVPGTFHGTKLRHLPNIRCLDGVDLAKALKRKIQIQNDAACFALGELHYGAARGKRTIVGVTLGTGLGTGVIIEKKPYRGARCLAGELGHTRSRDGTQWENLLSGKAISKRHTGKETRASDIWNSSTKAAKTTQKETAQLLAVFCENLIRAYDPDLIVIGGGAATKIVVRDANKNMPRGCKILKKSSLGVDAALLGAARL